MPHMLSDPFALENYPWQMGSDSPAALAFRQDGHRDRWQLLVEHVVAGGALADAPFPSLNVPEKSTLRPVPEGMHAARHEALEQDHDGVFDAVIILADLEAEYARERAEQEA